MPRSPLSPRNRQSPRKACSPRSPREARKPHPPQSPRQPGPNPWSLFQRSGSPVTDAAMVQALPSADPGTQQRIALAFLESQSPLGLTALVEQFAALPRPVQAQLIHRIDRLYQPLRKVLEKGDAPAAWHAAELIRQADRPQLSDLLAQRLNRSGDPAAPKIAQALLSFAVHHPRHRIVAEAIDSAARAHSLHGLDALLTAGLHRLPGPAPRLTQAFAEATGPTVQAARRLTRRAQSPVIQNRLLAIGRLPNMRQAAADGIQAVCRVGKPLTVLAQGHLLALADTRAPLRRLPEPHVLWPSAEQLADPDADPQALRQLPTLAAALPGGPIAPLKRLAAIRTCADPVARLSALRRLLSHRDPNTQAAAGNAVAAFTLDADPAIARLALGHLHRTNHPMLADALRKLAASKSEHLKALARPKLAERRFDQTAESWPKLDAAGRHRQALRLVQTDRHLPQRLSALLKTGTPDRQLTALSLIRACGLSQSFQAALIRLTAHPNPRVAASAVIALQGLNTSAAAQAIVQAAQHPDPRVRANAIEISLPPEAPEAPEGPPELPEALQHPAPPEAQDPPEAPEAPRKGPPHAASSGVASPSAALSPVQQGENTSGNAQAHDTATNRSANKTIEPKNAPPLPLIKHCQDRVSRPRANAIAALSDRGQGPWLKQLRAMLNDPRESHRVSAIWVTESRRILEAADTLAEHATSDPSPNIRTRAHRALQSLLNDHGPVRVKPPGSPAPNPAAAKPLNTPALKTPRNYAAS